MPDTAGFWARLLQAAASRHGMGRRVEVAGIPAAFDIKTLQHGKLDNMTLQAVGF